VNFTERGGGSVAPVSRAIASAIRWTWRARGEPTTSWVRLAELRGLIADSGWSLDEQVAGPGLCRRYLAASRRSIDGVSPNAVLVLAQRP
jgi:hypothetical protein